MSTEREQELRMTISKARDELNKLEAQQLKKENKEFLGKCFKYDNCYSMAKPNEHWWDYAKVTKLTNGSCHGIKFETDCNGKIEIESDCFLWVSKNFSLGYIEIPDKEFFDAWKELKKKINDIIY